MLLNINLQLYNWYALFSKMIKKVLTYIPKLVLKYLFNLILLKQLLRNVFSKNCIFNFCFVLLLHLYQYITFILVNCLK